MDRRQFLGSVLASSVATGIAVCVPERVLAEAAAGTAPTKMGTAHRASVSDFGADLTGHDDVTAAVRRAIASLSRTGARLVFPAGRYNFAASDDVAMRFDGYDGLEVFGNGADLLFAGNTQPFLVTGSKNIEIHDVKLDWARPPFSQGTVAETAPGSFTIAIDPEFPVTGAEQVDTLAEYDAKTALPATHGVQGTVTAVRLAGRQRLHVETTRNAGVQTGMRLVLRHRAAGTACIQIQGSEMVLLESVALYAGNSDGALLEGCRDVSLEDVNVGTRTGGRRLLSVNGAGVRLVDCHGALAIKRSGFRSMGGNAVEAHQPYWKIRSRLDDKTVLVETSGGRPFAPWQLPETGSILQLSEGSRLTLLGEIGLATAETSAGGAKFAFKETLSPVIVPGTLVCNALAQPRTTIDHCTFAGNGGDGVVVHGKAHITNSRFAGCAGAAVRMAAEIAVLEGPTVQSVTVADNNFDGCNAGQGSADRGTILVGVAGEQRAGQEAKPDDPERVNQGITIQRNSFTRDGGAAIRCSAASWVTIEGNIFGPVDRNAGAATPQAIVLRNVDQSFLQMNQSKVQQSILLIGCTERVQAAENVLLAEVRQA